MPANQTEIEKKLYEDLYILKESTDKWTQPM
jgi:hypothetical protein